ncbi:uncharacterized protein AFUA_2G10630 [Aspergillus fumigatus Af293]|uniref:Uncharacterized protein n=2 Tax=Aspergillus fumigatus TaxID=746128 RepID=Q4X1A7_ASPFU|nr:hypothetical protein AFUA_2G10630 [Aspergillus fumigatus Af293]EAL93358.1 hypothetical protein AFUA_2G10630 [Aspergillus fumigatus Af293]EDP54582.1 hypothetical protein AFUB_026410 [Aspergillus fumigatus A1163]
MIDDSRFTRILGSVALIQGDQRIDLSVSLQFTGHLWSSLQQYQLELFESGGQRTGAVAETTNWG